MRYFHITHPSNNESIVRNGLHPARSVYPEEYGHLNWDEYAGDADHVWFHGLNQVPDWKHSGSVWELTHPHLYNLEEDSNFENGAQNPFFKSDSYIGPAHLKLVRSRGRTSATARKPAKPKMRAPEEVWHDVHKHPEGVPGGMGKSPEYHLRNRGWMGHEINEGSGKKTIQYRHQEHPDFVISYGGGTSTKPDHNFRVLYMGTNTNIPKVNRAYSLAEAMNKVEELHQLHSGLVVQPMTHGASSELSWEHIPNYKGDLPAGMQDWNWDKFSDNVWLDSGYDHAKVPLDEARRLNRLDHDERNMPRENGLSYFHDIMWKPDKNGLYRTKKVDKAEFKTKQDAFFEREARRGYWDDGNVFHEYYDHNEKPCFNCGEVHHRPLTHGAAASIGVTDLSSGAVDLTRSLRNDFRPRHFVAPKIPPSRQDMTDHDFHPIGKPETEFPTKPDSESDWTQLKEIKTLPEPSPVPAFKPAPVEKTKTQTKIKYGCVACRRVALLRTARQESWKE